MMAIQSTTIIALFMLLRLHLQESLPTLNPITNPPNFTLPSFTNSYSTNENSKEMTSRVGTGLGPGEVQLLTILPKEDNTRFKGGALVIISGKSTVIRFLTESLSTPSAQSTFQITFTKSTASHGTRCDDVRDTAIFAASLGGDVLQSSVTLEADPEIYYICLRGNSSSVDTSPFIHQGVKSFMKVLVVNEEVRTTIMPKWLQIILIIFLLLISGLFSGLNLGLMSLDKTELSIMIASGTKKEQGYSRKILPLRKRGNYLLCTILLGNVLVNNCLTILLDDLTGSGISAILVSTFAIVLFGEIIPQAICSRYGLAIGARTIYFTKFFMFITFPLSFPISLILDKILGEEIGQVYNRDRLRELLKLTEKDMDLQRDEFNIITGALDLSKKTVKEIMTKLDDVFMIEYNALLDFSTVTSIMESGYTRVPIYEKERSNITALLNVKDLALVDPDNRVALKTVTQFYKHNVTFVFEDTKLDVILSDFKKGGSHMAMVQTVCSEGPGDPYYVVTGLVTLEDVIEEIIQAEIYDESDTITDNIRKEPRLLSKKDFSLFQTPTDQNIPHLSPQLKLATYQYFTANLLPFKSPHITDRILHRLLNQNIVVDYTYNENIPCYLFQHSRPCDYFIFIVEGRVQVQCGKENLTYEAGAFSYFGTQSLLVPSFRNPNSLNNQSTASLSEEPSWVLPSAPFVPDYTVQTVGDLQYVKIRRDQYSVAHRSSRHEAGLPQAAGNASEDLFERDWCHNNQIYVSDAIEDRLRRQMKLKNPQDSPFFIPPHNPKASNLPNIPPLSNAPHSLLHNLKKSFVRSPLNNEYRSFYSGLKYGKLSPKELLRQSVDEPHKTSSFHSTHSIIQPDKPRSNSDANFKQPSFPPTQLPPSNPPPPSSISPSSNKPPPTTPLHNNFSNPDITGIKRDGEGGGRKGDGEKNLRKKTKSEGAKDDEEYGDEADDDSRRDVDGDDGCDDERYDEGYPSKGVGSDGMRDSCGKDEIAVGGRVEDEADGAVRQGVEESGDGERGNSESGGDRVDGYDNDDDESRARLLSEAEGGDEALDTKVVMGKNDKVKVMKL